MFDDALFVSILRGAVLAIAALFYIVMLTRIVGLRSFSKMTSFDFVMTVAMGSLLAGASQATDWRGVLQPLAAMAGLFIGQWAAARARKVSDGVENALQNVPVVLMRDGVIDDAALKATRVSRSDLISKLREANALSMSDVRAVVLETTGDISVLHGPHLQEALLSGTRSVAET